jgi:hypothetical protein
VVAAAELRQLDRIRAVSAAAASHVIIGGEGQLGVDGTVICRVREDDDNALASGGEGVALQRQLFGGAIA